MPEAGQQMNLSAGNTVNRIAVVRLSSLGDIVHTLPAVSVIRASLPDAVIHWFVEPRGAELLQNFSGIDRIVPVNLKTGGVTGRIRELGKLIHTFRGNFDIVLDFQGLLKSAVLSRLLGKNTAGFHRANLREKPARFFYRRTAPFIDEAGHVILKNIHLLKCMGLSSDVISYPLKNDDFSESVKGFMKKEGLKKGDYVILNTGGGWESKLLSRDQNLSILKGIKASLKKVIIWGNEKEKLRAVDLCRETNAVITPFLDFSDLILFIKNADSIISADSLPLHLADAVNTRSAGIFGPTSPLRNGTLNRESISVTNEIECSFCYRRSCSYMNCISGINMADITAFVNRE